MTYAIPPGPVDCPHCLNANHTGAPRVGWWSRNCSFCRHVYWVRWKDGHLAVQKGEPKNKWPAA